MSLQHVLNALSSLITAACVGGLLLNLAAQTAAARMTSTRLLALIGAALLLWALIDVVLVDTKLEDRTQIAASAMTLTVLVYFVFIKRFVHSEMLLAPLLTLAVPFVFAANLLIIWVTSENALGFVFILLTVYAAAAFWLVMISRYYNAPPLRVASLIIAIACASPLVFSDWLFSGTLLLVGVGISWIGWSILRAQTLEPLTALREELRTANSDLRQATSEAARLRAQNEVLNRELHASGQYRSDFLDQLGHKLRTPLNSIAGYTELLQSGLYGDLNETQHDRLATVQRNGSTLLDVISNMLDLNKINAGRLELKRTQVSINPLITQILQPLEAQYSTKGLTLKIDLDPELPTVSGDEIRICQIITQLIDNAHKFTCVGGITVRSRCIHVQNGVSTQFALPIKGWLTDGAWVLVEVSDTGIGITSEDQAQVFDAFYQIPDPRTEEYFGTGQGLAIAKRLTELHEGVLWLKSAPEQGTTVFLALHPTRA